MGRIGSSVRWLLAALAAWGPLACAAAADSPLQEIEAAARAVERGAPLPAWADLASLEAMPPQAARRPIEVLLHETQVHAGPAPVRLTHRAVQANDVAALSEIGQLALEFSPTFERLQLHRVWILRGGQVVDHTRSAPLRLLQREARLEDGVYSGVITASIVLPGVRVGDVLQLVFSVAGDNPAAWAGFSRHVDWEQPHRVALRRVTLLAPAAQAMRWHWFGGPSAGPPPAPEEQVVGGLRRWRFEAANLRPAEIESLMPPFVEPRRQLQFSAFPDWQAVARWAVDLFPPHAPPAELDAVLARWRALPDAQERASQALQWVQNEIRHWSVSVGANALRPQSPATVVQRGYGDCKDKALLLLTLLRALGIESRPVLAALAVRHDPAAMLPAPDVFDHVIVQARLDGREHYLDPTRHAQVGALSRMGQRFEGQAVLVADPDTTGLVTVRSPNRAEIFRTWTHERLSQPQAQGEGRLELEVRWVGLQAEALRASLRQLDEAGLRQFVAAGYEDQYPLVRVLGTPVVHDDAARNELTLAARLAVPELIRPAGPDRWAVPFSPNLGQAIALPARLARRFPLVLPAFPVTHCYRVEMDWPEPIALDTRPVARRLDTPHWRLQTDRRTVGRVETRTIEFTPKVAQVPAVEVPGFAQDAARMVELIGQWMLAGGKGASGPAGAEDAPGFAPEPPGSPRPPGDGPACWP